MKTPRGDDVTCWDMPDSDYCGGLKYDSLTTECQDKLEVCIELLIKYGKIKPKATLRETYNTYLHPDILDYTTTEMWDKCSNGEITDLFQFITPVGGKCIQKIKPHSLEEMANANSLMRINVENGIQPVDKFLAYKHDRNLWYEEFVPHHSVFYTFVRGEEILVNKFCGNINERIVQFGANASIGFGLMRLSVVGGVGKNEQKESR